jgi:hypothetical protein
MSRHLAASDFVSCVGKTFTAKGQHRALTLFSVNRSVPPGGEVLPREPFMLKRWPAQARTLRYQKQCLVLQQPRELARALREARCDLRHEPRHLRLHLVVRLQPDVEIQDNFVDPRGRDIPENFADARR